MRRWVDRLGIQVNKPPDGWFPDRERARMRWESPTRVRLLIYSGLLGGVAAILVVAGVVLYKALALGYLAGMTSQFIVEAWWKRRQRTSAEE